MRDDMDFLSYKTYVSNFFIFRTSRGSLRAKRYAISETWVKFFSLSFVPFSAIHPTNSVTHHKRLLSIPYICRSRKYPITLQRQTMEQREQNRMNSSYAES